MPAQVSPALPLDLDAGMPAPGTCTHCAERLQMFGGWNRQYKHKSETLGCDMVFTVFYPPAAEKGPVPVSCLCRLSCAGYAKLAS